VTDEQLKVAMSWALECTNSNDWTSPVHILGRAVIHLSAQLAAQAPVIAAAEAWRDGLVEYSAREESMWTFELRRAIDAYRASRERGGGE